MPFVIENRPGKFYSYCIYLALVACLNTENGPCSCAGSMWADNFGWPQCGCSTVKVRPPSVRFTKYPSCADLRRETKGWILRCPAASPACIRRLCSICTIHWPKHVHYVSTYQEMDNHMLIFPTKRFHSLPRSNFNHLYLHHLQSSPHTSATPCTRQCRVL